MNRSSDFSDFQEAYASIAPSDAKCAVFERLVSKLFSETYLVQAKKEDQSDYEDAIRYLKPLQLYFALGGFTLEYDQSNRLIYLRNEESRNSLHLKLLDTVVLLCLRSLQFKKTKEEAWNGVTVVTLKQLVTEIYDSKIYSEKGGKSGRPLLMSDLRESMGKLKKHKCIDYHGNLSSTDTEILIYDTVRLLVNEEKLDDLTLRLKQYKNGGNVDEATIEDSAD